MDPNLTQQIQQMIDTTLKNSFAQKRIGDSPTDALQLAPKKYVDSRVFTGQVKSDVAGTPFPKGWSVNNGSTGNYTITHNLGTTNYSVSVTELTNGTPTPAIFNIYSNTTTSFVVNSIIQSLSGGSWSSTNTDFMFTVTVSPT